MYATIDALENDRGTVIGLGATPEDAIREPAEYEDVSLDRWSARLSELRKLTFPCTDAVANAVANDAGPVLVRLRGAFCRGSGAGAPARALFLDLPVKPYTQAEMREIVRGGK